MTSLSRTALNQKYHQKVYREGSFNVPIRYLYLEERILASSNEGHVILAHDRETHRDVVIKKRKFPFVDRYWAKRTHREFLLSQFVDHENVIRLLNAFTPQTTPGTFSELYLVMEYLQYPLKKLIDGQKFKKANGSETCSYLMYQLLCGIRHLHQTGIIHRDLSVNNVMIEQQNNNQTLKIIDFGAARIVPDHLEQPELFRSSQNCPAQTKVTAFVTTRFYRAPEMVLGLKMVERNGKQVAQLHSEIDYGKKVDLWAAGCILAEMLKGKILFEGKDNTEQWSLIIKALGTPNPDFISTLPDEIRESVDRYPQLAPKPWEELFPDNLFRKKEETDTRTARAARDLLSNLLVIDPASRYSADDALTHEYVAKWGQEPGEMKETSPVYVYNGYIEDLEYSEADWTKVIFFEIKQYELMSLRSKDLNIGIQECPKCIEHRCSCSVCNERNLETLLIPNQLGLSEKCDAIERE